MNALIPIKQFESIMNNISKKAGVRHVFTGKFYQQIYRNNTKFMEIILIFHNLFQILEEEGTIPKSSIRHVLP